MNTVGRTQSQLFYCLFFFFFIIVLLLLKKPNRGLGQQISLWLEGLLDVVAMLYCIVPVK